MTTATHRPRIWDDAPCLVISCDVDWASEAIIEDCCEGLTRLGVRPMLFSTHESENVAARETEGTIEVGIHPNFFPGSSQGEDYGEVIDFMLNLHPDARISRSHSYFDNSRVAALLAEKGIRHDSNVCYFLEPDLRARRMWSGAHRFPVFWEDDVNWATGRDFRFDEDDRRAFSTPGLKIIDIHPTHYAFNTASAEQYGKVASTMTSATARDVERHRFEGPGTRDYVGNLIGFAKDAGIRILSMHEMIDHQMDHYEAAA